MASQAAGGLGIQFGPAFVKLESIQPTTLFSKDPADCGPKGSGVKEVFVTAAGDALWFCCSEGVELRSPPLTTEDARRDCHFIGMG